MKYANAAKIFPQPLLDEMRKHFPAGLLWVPRYDDHRIERNDLIATLVENGEPVKEVATIAKLSCRHVYRIVRERRKNQPPENPEPAESAPAVSSISSMEGDDAQ